MTLKQGKAEFRCPDCHRMPNTGSTHCACGSEKRESVIILTAAEHSELRKEVETLTWMRDGAEAEFNIAFKMIHGREWVKTLNDYGSSETLCLYCGVNEGKEHKETCEFKRLMQRRPNGLVDVPMPAYASRG